MQAYTWSTAPGNDNFEKQTKIMTAEVTKSLKAATGDSEENARIPNLVFPQGKTWSCHLNDINVRAADISSHQGTIIWGVRQRKTPGNKLSEHHHRMKCNL